MRKCLTILAAALIAVSTSDRRANGANLQQPAAAPGLVDEFRGTAVFWQQLDVAKKIVALKSTVALGRLEPWLTNEDRHIRGNVAFVFAGLGDRRGLDVIAAILTDQSDRPEGQGTPGVRWSLPQQIRSDRYYAVHLFGELRDPRAVDVILPLLTDEQVNFKVAWALGQIGDRRAIGPLIGALRDSTALMRIAAVHGLEQLRAKEALPHLRALVDDPALPSAGDQVSVGETARAAIQKLETKP